MYAKQAKRKLDTRTIAFIKNGLARFAGKFQESFSKNFLIELWRKDSWSFARKLTKICKQVDLKLWAF